jgi:hypothetical protein
MAHIRLIEALERISSPFQALSLTWAKGSPRPGPSRPIRRMPFDANGSRRARPQGSISDRDEVPGSDPRGPPVNPQAQGHPQGSTVAGQASSDRMIARSFSYASTASGT